MGAGVRAVREKMRWPLLAGLLSLLLSGAAQAVPVTYFFTSGEVTVTGFVNGGLVAGPVTVGLTGISVTLDEGALSLDSISLSAGSVGPVSINPAYNGYDSITLDFALATAAGGTLVPVDPGPPAEYFYSITNVNVSGQFDASGTSPPLTDQLFGFVNPTASGTIFLDGFGVLELDGITLGEIQPFGAPDPLVLKGDFVFTGVVPEPGTALLMLTGLAGLAAAGRRRHGIRSIFP